MNAEIRLKMGRILFYTRTNTHIVESQKAIVCGIQRIKRQRKSATSSEILRLWQILINISLILQYLRRFHCWRSVTFIRSARLCITYEQDIFMLFHCCAITMHSILNHKKYYGVVYVHIYSLFAICEYVVRLRFGYGFRKVLTVLEPF